MCICAVWPRPLPATTKYYAYYGVHVSTVRVELWLSGRPSGGDMDLGERPRMDIRVVRSTYTEHRLDSCRNISYSHLVLSITDYHLHLYECPPHPRPWEQMANKRLPASCPCQEMGYPSVTTCVNTLYIVAPHEPCSPLSYPRRSREKLLSAPAAETGGQAPADRVTVTRCLHPLIVPPGGPPAVLPRTESYEYMHTIGWAVGRYPWE
jgi:hypothetical protein